MALLFNSVIADLISWGAVIFIALYIYFSYKYSYWKKRGIYYVKPALFVGNLGRVMRQKEGPLDLYRRVYEEAPGHPVVGTFIFHKPILLIRDLEVVRCILAKDANNFLDRFILPTEKIDRLFSKSLFARKGNEWKHLRIKLAPTFTSGKIKKMFQLVEECGKQLVTYVDQDVAKGKPVEVKDTMSRYTTDVIASCAFGVKANAMEEPNCEFITMLKKLFQPTGYQMIFGTLMLFNPSLQMLISAKTFDRGVNDFVRKTFWGVVDYRKAKGIGRKDFVDLLMQLREDGEVHAEDAKELEEIKQDSKYMNLEHSKTAKSNFTFDDDDYAAQALLFMAAGYETSSSVLSFTLYELALNPAIQDKLRREVDYVLEKHAYQLTYDAISEITYLDMVVSEAMRKYPPLPLLDRVCLSDCKIEGTGISIEKGTVVFIPAHGIHYDPDIYPDPERFDPERFTAENRAKRPNFAYLPFGEGPRKCIGMRFGLLQVKLGLVHILKTFQVRPCEDTPRPPLEIKRVSGTLAPEKDIFLTFTKLK